MSQEHQSPTRLPLPTNSSYQREDGIKRRSLLPQRSDPTTTGPVLISNSRLKPSRAIPGSKQPAAAQPQTQKVEDLSEPDNRLIPAHGHKSNGITGQQRAVGSRGTSVGSTNSAHADSYAVNTHREKQSLVSRQPSGLRALGLSRSQSLRRPTAPDESIRKTNVRSHMRNRSVHVQTASSETARPEGKLLHDSISRPLSAASRSSHESLVAGSSEPKKGASASTNVLSKNSTGLQRTASNAIRVPRITPPSRPQQSDESSTQNGVTHKRLNSVNKGVSQTRPAFTTLQQHYSPKKSDKQPTAAILASVTPEQTGVQTLPPELVFLQAELLQLHLMHTSSADTLRLWERSAERKLQRKFNAVKAAHRTLLDRERQVQEQINLLALQQWIDNISDSALADNIQSLSSIMQELPALISPGGKYSRVLGEFELWVRRAQDVWQAQHQASLHSGPRLHFIEGLGNAWKAEHAALVWKLMGKSRDVESIAEPLEGSSLAVVVKSCLELLHGMSAELQIMRDIETRAVSEARKWIDEDLASMAEDLEMNLSESQAGYDFWRQL